MLVLVTSITLGVMLHRIELVKGKTNKRRRFVLAPFHVFLIGFFIAAVVLSILFTIMIF